MAKRRFGKKGRAASKKIALHAIVPAAVLGVGVYNGYKNAGMTGAMAQASVMLSGYNPTNGNFQGKDMVPFYGSILASYFGGKLIAMSGVNRAMKALPFRL